MSDLRQAAQMALEALEGWEHCDEWVWPVSALEQSKRNTTESLAALRTALEQQAEPVAQVHPNHLKQSADGNPWCREVLLYSGNHEGDLLNGENYRVKLYTTPPQRPWVGLTVTTILNMMPSAIPAEYDGPLMEFARAIEAKLEKKNGY